VRFEGAGVKCVVIETGRERCSVKVVSARGGRVREGGRVVEVVGT